MPKFFDLTFTPKKKTMRFSVTSRADALKIVESLHSDGEILVKDDDGVVLDTRRIRKAIARGTDERSDSLRRALHSGGIGRVAGSCLRKPL